MVKKKLLLFVAGFPIRHSLSPRIFRYLANKTGIDLHYTRLSTEDPNDISKLLELGFNGGNITMPVKEKICQLPFVQSPNVQLIRAANVIYRKENIWYLENTDIIGVKESLRPFEKHICNQPALVIGAGGAGRAAVLALREYTHNITLTNRTHEKSLYWAEKLSTQILPFEQIAYTIYQFKVIIYTIPVYIPLNIEPFQIFLEANYSKSFYWNKTPFFIGGLYWLIHQAIPSFELLTGKDPKGSITSVETIIKEIT
ncbi:MAG: hypothetical protein N2Z72_03140 [Bacteroidales bacterium]|nr:hypothetical protein [Bacteroidales bacterium]